MSTDALLARPLAAWPPLPPPRHRLAVVLALAAAFVLGLALARDPAPATKLEPGGPAIPVPTVSLEPWADAELARRVAEGVARGATVVSSGHARWRVEGNGARFDVVVRDGAVTLVGTVRRWPEVVHVAKAAREAAGTHSVEARLRPRLDRRVFDPYAAEGGSGRREAGGLHLP